MKTKKIKMNVAKLSGYVLSKLINKYLLFMQFSC